MNRYTKVRELVKDPSLRVTEIAWKTGYNKGHVSRLRRNDKSEGAMSREAMKLALDMLNEIADDVYCDQKLEGVITALRQALETEREWVGLTDEEVNELVARFKRYSYVLLREVEAKLKEKNHG